MMFFSPNTPIDQCQIYGDLLHMRVVDNLDNYFGLPLSIGKKKSMTFHSILNIFSCRINIQSKRLLSYGGKEIFITSILQSPSTYALFVFHAPRGTLEEMQSKISQISWVCKEKGRGCAMLAWDKVCLPKGMGGLGFRDLRRFKLALLSR